MNKTLSGATISGQSGPGCNGNEVVLRIPQSSSITGTSPSDCFISKTLVAEGKGSYHPAEKQSVYSIAPAFSVYDAKSKKTVSILVWVGLVLWYINNCRLFNAKSISLLINSFISTIQFSISTQFKYQNHSIPNNSV